MLSFIVLLLHQIFISKSYDATTHFETCCEDIMDMYERIIGEKLDLSSLPYSTETEDWLTMKTVLKFLFYNYSN